MQETASNLLGRYFKKQPQHPQSKKQENISKNEHPLIIKFATDPYMGTKVEGSMDTKIDFEMNHILLPKKVFLNVLKELERLKPLEIITKEQGGKITELNREIEDLSAQCHQSKNAV